MIKLGDCLEGLRALPDNSVDSIVTDPPYGLKFMGKAWDYDVPPEEVWRECLRVLKPGGHLLCFAGTRTQHRMAVRIEDAGFEIRDMIAWVYGSGFPKSLDVSKAIDKAAGAEREVVGSKTVSRDFTAGEGEDIAFRSGRPGQTEVPVTAAATPEAQRWEGWGTALKPALEPITVARKPLTSSHVNVLQMVESQLRERGVRGEILWKPESASAAAKSKRQTSSSSTEAQPVAATSAKNAVESVMRKEGPKTLKKFDLPMPHGANQSESMCASTTSASATSCATKCSQPTAEHAHAAEKLSAISSPSTTSMAAEVSTGNPCMERSTTNSSEKASPPDTECFAGIATGLTGSIAHVHIKRDSSGFYLWPKGLPEFVPGVPLTVAANVLAHGTGGLNIDGCRVETSDDLNGGAYSVERKPSESEWVKHGGTIHNSTGQEFVQPAGRWPANLIHDGGDEVVALFPASNGSGSAARFFYCAKASKADRDEGLDDLPEREAGSLNMRTDSHSERNGMTTTPRRNAHPTVKPTALMRYLCRLVTPPGGLVLDPYTGSGSTAKAAALEGFRFIGFEIDPDYHAIAERRWLAAIGELA